MQRMSTQKGRRIGIRRLRVGSIGFLTEEVVRSEIFVEVDVDRADVSGADGSHAEEAVAPAAEEDNAFVEGEEVGHAIGDVG